jgi:hypothetical protein
MGYTPFKMKGSPAKRGSIHGTEGHRSALQKASPAKAGPLLPVLAAGLRTGLTRLAATSGAQAVKKTVQKGIQSIPYTSFKEIIPSAGKSGMMKKVMDFGKGMFTWPSTIASTASYMYGSSQGKKSEKARLENIGKSTGLDNKTKTNTKTKTKTKTKTSTGDPYAKAKKKDPNLPSYIKERKKHAKGSAEYNAIQNKINAAYGVSKRHGTVSASGSASAGSSSGSQTKYKKRLFGGQTKVTRSNGDVKKERYSRKGELKKTITKSGGRRTVTDAEGNIIRSRKIR